MVTSFVAFVKVYVYLNVKKLVYVLIMRNVLCYLMCALPLLGPHARSERKVYMVCRCARTETKVSLSQLPILLVQLGL
jgi:hypothetical protein